MQGWQLFLTALGLLATLYFGLADVYRFAPFGDSSPVSSPSPVAPSTFTLSVPQSPPDKGVTQGSIAASPVSTPTPIPTHKPAATTVPLPTPTPSAFAQIESILTREAGFSAYTNTAPIDLELARGAFKPYPEVSRYYLIGLVEVEAGKEAQVAVHKNGFASAYLRQNEPAVSAFSISSDNGTRYFESALRKLNSFAPAVKSRQK